MFKIEFFTDSDAVKDGETAEIARILKEVGRRVREGATGGTVRDAMREQIGSWSLKWEERT